MITTRPAQFTYDTSAIDTLVSTLMENNHAIEAGLALIQLLVLSAPDDQMESGLRDVIDFEINRLKANYIL